MMEPAAMQAAAAVPEAHATGLDVASDPPLYTPFLNPVGSVGAISRPRPAKFSFAAACEHSKPPSPIKASASLTNGTTTRHVTWALNCSLVTSTAAAAAAAGPAGQSDRLMPTHSAPAADVVKMQPGAFQPAAAGGGGGGDLRDQGRLSSAGALLPGPAPRRASIGSIHPAVSALWGDSSAVEEVVEEAHAPLQGAVNINSLLGSTLFSSLSSPPVASKAAAAADNTQQQGPGACLPDFIEAWEGGSNSSPGSATAPAAQPVGSSNGHGGLGSRAASQAAGSAFAGPHGAAAAAAARLMMGPVHQDEVCMPPINGSNGSSHCSAGMLAHPPLHQLAHHASCSPALQPNFSAGMHVGSLTGGSIAAPTNAAAAAAVAALGQPWDLLQHASSVGGVMPGYPHQQQLLSSSGLAPTLSGAYMPHAPAVLGDAAAGMAAHHLYGYHPGGCALMPALQSVQSAPLSSSACAGGSNPALAAAIMHAHSTAAAQAWALQAYITSTLSSGGGSFNSNDHHSGSGSSGGGSGWSGAASRYGPPFAGSSGSGGSQGGPMMMQRRPHQPLAARRFVVGSPASSKADPQSLCGVDPRLCVGSPEDVFAELCRRHPGLAELLRLPPHSVRLRHVPVLADTSPPELLVSKRPEGPITPQELTIESGLLRHCFGLPSSIGPDLVRAARHAVTRSDDAPGSGLAPFFWVLQAKLNWLLRRPIFFKGQLLRGEIHAITDLQRAQSFARVTEQRSKLGELLLVLFDMLKPLEEHEA